MYEDFVPERIAQLRTKKGVSARDMSLSLGQANNYINNIENKKSLPAMQSFFYICEYLGVTPKEFFDDENADPTALREFIQEAQRLDAKSMEYILGIMKELNSRKRADNRKCVARSFFLRRGRRTRGKKAASNAKRYPLCENRRIPFTRNPPVSCLLGRCPNPRRTQNLCSETMDKSIGCAILQIACWQAAQRCSASFSRRSFASSCSLSSSRIRSILALAVSSSFISSRAFR